MAQYRVKVDKLGHFQGKQWPKGTVVSGKPYEQDPEYLEIVTPDGFALTVSEGWEVEPLVIEEWHLDVALHLLQEYNLRQSDPTREHYMSAADLLTELERAMGKKFMDILALWGVMMANIAGEQARKHYEGDI